MIIYKLTNKINNKIYIGQAKDLKTRFRHYKYNVKQYKNAEYKGNQIIVKALSKYGFDNFSIDIIYKCKTQDELDKMEVFWIALYNSRNLAVGYNMNAGGLGNRKPHSEKSKKQMSQSKIGKHFSPNTEFKKGIIPWNKGTRGIMKTNSGTFTSQRLKGIPKSEDHKRKIGDANRQISAQKKGIV